MSYSLEPNRPTPCVVIDIFDKVGKEGVYAGTQEDCEAFIAENSDGGFGGYKIVPNWRH